MDPTGYTTTIVEERSKIMDIESEKFKIKFNERFKTYQNFFSFTVVILLSLIFMLFFRREKKYYIEHLILALNIASFFLALGIIFGSLNALFNSTSGFGLGLSPDTASLVGDILFDYPVLILQLIYIYTAFRKFYGSSVKRSIIVIPAIFILLFLAQRTITVISFLIIFNTTSG